MSSTADILRASASGLRGIVANTARLRSLVWSEKKRTVILLTAVVLLVSVTPALKAGSAGLLVNELVHLEGNGTVGSDLVALIALVIFANIFSPVISAVQLHITTIFLYYVEEKIEILLIEKKSQIDLENHERPKVNDLINLVQENASARAQWFVSRQFLLLQNLIEVAIASSILIFANRWIFLAILIGTLPELMTETKYGRIVWSIYVGKAEIRRRFLDLRAHFFSLPSLIELRLFQNVHYFLDIIRELFAVFKNEERKNERKKLSRQLLSLISSQVSIGLATVWFVLQVVKGELRIGTMTFLLASIGGLRLSLSGFFSELGKQYRDSLFVADIFRFVDIESTIRQPVNAFALPPLRTPRIAFQGVGFTYPGTSHQVLKNITLEITPGEKLAIVGTNGSGKTTLVKLLCRLYDPDEGSIAIDDWRLDEIELESWYEKLGILFQDYAAFHLPAKEVISIGRTGREMSMPRVVRAAKESGADRFIRKWADGYDQMLGKQFTGGIELSTGQWQRLTLARTFYRDPQVFILDEPTSSLDAEGEAGIFEKMRSLGEDTTVLLISHRFSTVRHADRICVLEDGRIKELGSHEELLRHDGTYARLFRLQAQGYK